MSKRKGELSTATIDRTWPHQVAIPHREQVARWAEIKAFCQGMSQSPLGHTYFADDQDMNVLCFARREDAERVAQRFGGTIVDPKDRPRWGRPRSPRR